jgi:hypothetical protein
MLPSHIDIYCDLCTQLLFTSLHDYAVTPAAQSHLTQQIYTNTPPDNDASVVATFGGTLNCRKNCHGTSDIEAFQLHQIVYTYTCCHPLYV